MSIEIFKIGDICLVKLPKCGKYCLHGLHKCVICGRSGSNYVVAPISSNRKELKLCEYPVEAGRCGMAWDSKIKLDQIRPVSAELVLKRDQNRADEGMLKAISNYLKKEAEEIENFRTAA
ncbi:type II toxin-antitoxin system PemK/MazF family toxin [Dyadobacter pollutisoli]|uniref:Type II toxin-antitoxin system PemK/MazF family toxin n=1 Tax=Dyadobacter pollutisoli TaxID=2910158 RepID=A0A9E8SKY4_9BACT|nr:type II toxin-antitoxin system PemK/MazF family toxin [Dyadobacter pollutisoli]WAC11236.1 type II toxin-antitoxin system PemK/MazF family toxin [Dyadobacter pollutisoli]